MSTAVVVGLVVLIFASAFAFQQWIELRRVQRLERERLAKANYADDYRKAWGKPPTHAGFGFDGAVMASSAACYVTVGPHRFQGAPLVPGHQR